MKPGYKTSELWVTVAAGIATVLSKHLHINITGTMVIDGLAAVYATARTLLKANDHRALTDWRNFASRIQALENNVTAISSIIPVPPTKQG